MLRHIVLSCLWICCLQAPAFTRTWTDARGTQIEGDLVGFGAGRITVRGNEGHVTQLPFSDLSPSDRAFVAFAAASREPRELAAESLTPTTRGISTRDARSILRTPPVDEIAGLTTKRAVIHALPAPASRVALQPAQTPAPPATIEDSAACCYPKYIYCGQKGTFHIVGDAGMATYSIGCDQWLARLVPMKPNHPHRDLYFRPVCDDPMTDGWAFSTVPNCLGHYAIYRLVRGTWCLFDSATRTVPN
ncbi:MAG: hypothetical protein K2Y37_12425 [Pirellulales bacterium]|nr:hypothetical protein [Pirellulales bacterium]